VTIEISGWEELIPTEVLDVMTQDMVDQVLSNIAESARNEWIRLAGEGLFTTKGDYIRGIQPVEMKPGLAIIALLGELPNLVEEGMDTLDLHDTLLGPNVPISEPGEFGKHLSIDPKTFKTGYYRAIPFRHGVPDSEGAVGQPMGRPYGGHDAVQDAKKLGQAVYEAAKKLKGTTSDPASGKVKYGGRLKAGMAPLLKPHHSTDIYAGMIKERKKYRKKTQSQYMTFRTISTGSPGWIRPATTGKFYSQQVGAFVQKIAPQAFSAYVGGL